jgi:hypothetical protein
VSDPDNAKLNHVNTTESKICGVPVDPLGTANTTTIGAKALSIAPST